MLRNKKIFIFVGHPNADTFNGALASEYEQAAKDAGHEVRRMNIGEMTFDPILHKGYKVIQELESDLLLFQENVRWCDHLVIVYPIWWSSMPALMKGMLERVWLPAFAYRFKKNGLGWSRLLKGKSARVIVTSDSHPFILWLVSGGTLNHFTRAFLWFSGFGPVRKTWFSGMRKLKPEKAVHILRTVHALGRKGR